MKIKPLGNRVYIRIDGVSAGALDLSSKPTVVETGEVIGIGSEVTLDIRAGDRIFFKAWAVDIVSQDDRKYHFIAQDTNGIVAVIK